MDDDLERLALAAADLRAEPDGCSGQCLSGYDIGIDNGGIAYPHPDCPAHGDQWVPYDNKWSRQYVADHPERFQPPACSSPTRNHGDGRGCESDTCPRHGEPRERPWEYVLGPEEMEG